MEVINIFFIFLFYNDLINYNIKKRTSLGKFKRRKDRKEEKHKSSSCRHWWINDNVISERLLSWKQDFGWNRLIENHRIESIILEHLENKKFGRNK